MKYDNAYLKTHKKLKRQEELACLDDETDVQSMRSYNKFEQVFFLLFLFLIATLGFVLSIILYAVAQVDNAIQFVLKKVKRKKKEPGSLPLERQENT